MNPNRRLRPDSSTADRLLAGHVGPDDAPPGYRRVATLLGKAVGDFSEPPGPVEATLISTMVAAIQAEPVPLTISGRKPMLRKVLAAKTIAIASVLALSASGAAAATGNLPDAVQDKVAKAAKHVGVNLPEGTKRVTVGCEEAKSETLPRNRGQFLKMVRENGGNLEAAKLSRCGMPLVSQGTPGTDEGDEGESHGKSGESHGKSGESHGKSGEDQGKSGDQGAPAENPAGVETPAGSIETGDDASGGANETGSEHAGEGSDNADDHPGPGDLPVQVPGS